MKRFYFHKSVALLVVVVAVPALLWSIFEIVQSCAIMKPVLDSSSTPAAVERIFLLRGTGLVVTLITVLIGAIVWQSRLDRQVDALVDACRNIALGEQSPLPDLPSRMDELNRLSLAIQVMHEALLDYLSLYRRFFDSSPDMFLTLTPAGQRIMDANPAFCRAVDRLKDEVLGQPVDKFVRLDKSWDQALSEGGELITGFIQGQKGNLKVEANISLERGPEGQPWVLGAILRDVTLRDALFDELMKKSTALEMALEEIKNVEELKDEFLTTLSHELKTPLVSLKGFLQLLRQGGKDPQEAQKFLEICWRNLTKLENQINNLLDLARLSHSKDQYEMEPVDFSSLIRSSVENLQAVAGERDITLQTNELVAGRLMVRGNTSKLIQLVDNLLVNAIKYNKDKGQVEVGLEVDDKRAVLTVADSGIGINREHMATIFNRFYRADITGTGRLEGLGIGLSLVQEIVKLHGGDINVESEPGKGTTFTVSLEALR